MQAGWTMLGLTALVVGLVAVYVKVKLRGASLTALALKTVASLGFVALALFALWANEVVSAWAVAVLLALVCGVLGDVFLDLKLVERQHDAWFTYAGFVSFGVGHLVYWLYFLNRLDLSGSTLWWCLACIGMVVLVIALTERPTGLDYGRFRAITLAYAGVLGGALVLATCAWWQTPSLHLAWVVLGMLAFVASDVILSHSYFGKRPETPVLIVGNYVTYYAAQILLAWSVWWQR